MTIVTESVQIRSRGENDMIDITKSTSKAIEGSKLKKGTVTIFIAGSTAAVTTIEYEPGLRTDFPNMLSRIVPKNIEYEHDKTWHDGNGHSHVRASMGGPSLTVPFKDGRLLLGTWQQIVLVEMDIRQREREIILQIMGEYTSHLISSHLKCPENQKKVVCVYHLTLSP
jgi:secondary thiamine-phosphate synthase enzyme